MRQGVSGGSNRNKTAGLFPFRVFYSPTPDVVLRRPSPLTRAKKSHPISGVAPLVEEFRGSDYLYRRPLTRQVMLHRSGFESNALSASSKAVNPLQHIHDRVRIAIAERAVQAR